jgi:predicted TIM-barrel fold metal-dependent hydrolase
MAVIDVSAFVGTYPFRDMGGAGSAGWLVGQMDRLGVEQAWVGYLPSILQLDPTPGNQALEKITASFRDRLRAVPTINPEMPRWQDDLNRAFEIGAPAVRLFPQYQGLDPVGDEMRVMMAAAAAAGMPTILTVRLEDQRQRHPVDVAPELAAAAVRALVRGDGQTRLIVANAHTPFIEEVHFGLTCEEAARVLWDIAWVWGPPADDLARLLETVGHERFVFGSGMPLRVPDVAAAKLDLIDLAQGERLAILGENVRQWVG